MENEEQFFRRALGRISKAMFALGAGGAIGGWVWRGWPCAAGFALGAAAAWLNFRWWRQIVEALGPSRRRPRKRLVVFAFLRYLLLGGGAYVILRYSRINLLAALVGLFVPAGAVILEIFFELIYARSGSRTLDHQDL